MVLIWNSDFEIIWANGDLTLTDLGFTSSGYTLEINALERQTLKDLNYSITVDFTNLLTIFSKQDIDQLNTIVEDLKSLSGPRESFNQFISSIEKIITEKKEELYKLEEQRILEERRALEEKRSLEEQDGLYSRTKDVMRHVHLTTAQTVNACTLISIAVINAILNAEDESAMGAAIKKAHNEWQRRYREEFPHNLDNGQGILETEAFEIYYREIFAKPKKQSLAAPVSGFNLEDIIDSGNGFIRDNQDAGIELATILFIEQNGDLIAAIQKLAPHTQINWATIGLNELRRIIRLDQTPPLAQQFLPIITQLDFQGITIQMVGHTISLVKKGDTYYSYDSLTGDLSITKDPQEMITHLDKKIVKDHAKDAEVYFFTPIQDLMLTPKTVMKQEVPPTELAKQQVEVKESTVINAERIHDLIKNRDLFDNVTLWQQVNADLFTLIVSQLNGVMLTIEEWATISAKQLCALLNIKNDPVPVDFYDEISPSILMPKESKKTPLSTRHNSGKEHEIPVIPQVDELPGVLEEDVIQPVSDSEKLIDMIDQLIDNMLTQQNGRQTSRNSQWKANLLIDIKWGMQTTNPDEIDIAQCIADIRIVCAKKRNILHFWAEPHSVSEFERMLRDTEIAIPQTNVLIQ